MKVQPLGDRVVVEREEAKSMTAVRRSVLPDTAKDKAAEGGRYWPSATAGPPRTARRGRSR